MLMSTLVCFCLRMFAPALSLTYSVLVYMAVRLLMKYSVKEEHLPGDLLVHPSSPTTCSHCHLTLLYFVHSTQYYVKFENVV